MLSIVQNSNNKNNINEPIDGLFENKSSSEGNGFTQRTNLRSKSGFEETSSLVKPDEGTSRLVPKEPGSHSELEFPKFNSIKVSTKTFIVISNLLLDIDKLFEFLPITDYTLIPKKRGRKKKVETVDPNKDIPSGSIITLEYQSNIRGVDLKVKKKKNKNKKKRNNYFRNSLTVIMIIDNKKINYKVSRNGKFQMTGCKSDEHAEESIKWFWEYTKNLEELYKFNSRSEADSQGKINLEAIFIPAMRNIDFSLNFLVDREKLDEYFNTNTPYHSLLETSFGYTGVNIKIPVNKEIKNLMVKELHYLKDNWDEPVMVPYSKYLDMLTEKDVLKKIKKIRYNTFLVFHSGRIIVSGLETSFMEDGYYEFLDIIRDCSGIIEEKLR